MGCTKRISRILRGPRTDTPPADAIQRQRTTVASHERIGIFRVFGRDAGFTALYTAYVTSIRCVIPEYKVDLDKLIRLLIEEKHANPSNYALVVLSEGAEWEGYRVQEYGEPDADGHRKKASVAELLADEIKRRTGEETIASDLTYELRSGDPDFVDKLVGLTFGNMAYDAILDGKTGLMSALVNGCYELVPHSRPQARAPQPGRRHHVQHRAIPSDVRQQARAVGLSKSRVVGEASHHPLDLGMLVLMLLVEHRLEQVAALLPRVTSERYAIRSVTQPSAYMPVDGLRTPLLLSSSSSSPSTASAAITFSRCTWTYRLYS